ncbi:SDR family oxidoreductase [Gammaproteobacteria bacterium]|nr:SDR family oxidoreductase [Gammaproteobacteria bacterium]
MNFDNKLTLIAGGNSGIGLEIARGFYESGSDVIILGRNNRKNLEAIEDIKKNNKQKLLKSYVCDLSKEMKFYEVAKNIYKNYGRIDNFINCVGLWKVSPISKVTALGIKEMHDNNFLPLVLGTKIISSFMSKGSIVNLSSFAYLMPMKEGSIYSSYKAAAVTFTKSAADELSHKGIRVNIVTPGVIDTPMTRSHIEKNKSELIRPISLNRIGLPSEIVGPVLFLCSNDSSYITGENIIISGGKYITQK